MAAIISLDEDRHIGEVVAAYDNIAQVFLEGGILSLEEQPTMVNALGRLRQMRLTPQRNMRELRDLYKVLQILHTGPAYVQPLHADEHRLGIAEDRQLPGQHRQGSFDGQRHDGQPV